jgi:hypothetical protein
MVGGGMSSIYAVVNTALETLGLPVEANVDRDPDTVQLPDVFLVFYLIDDSPFEHADDEDVSRFVQVGVNYFDRDGLDEMPDIDQAMKAAGFLSSSKRELPYSRETGHFGMNCTYKKVEEKE